MPPLSSINQCVKTPQCQLRSASIPPQLCKFGVTPAFLLMKHKISAQSINQSINGWMCESAALPHCSWNLSGRVGSCQEGNRVSLTHSWTSRPHPTFPRMEHENALCSKQTHARFRRASDLKQSHRDTWIAGSERSALPSWCFIRDDVRDDGMEWNSHVFI